MSESDTIVYICTYYDSANRIQNIYCSIGLGLGLGLGVGIT